jgi:putative redox protein
MQKSTLVRNCTGVFVAMQQVECLKVQKLVKFTTFKTHQNPCDQQGSRTRKINMECTVTWTGAIGTRSGMGFVAETGSGHIVNMDGAPDAAKPENGGQNLAPRPMEMLLAGTGGCTAYDVVLILKRGRHDVRGCSVKISSERAEVDPKVFTQINMHFTVTAKGVPASAVERAIAMSHDKYCSASIMLGKTAEITTSFEVVEVA